MTEKKKAVSKKPFPAGDLDILEQSLFDYNKSLLEKLLVDCTTGSNIKWGTTDYEEYGVSFAHDKQIRPELVTGEHASVVQPRSAKSKEEQERRTHARAEVFTPSWVCNKQNNMIDRVWFGRSRVFNREKGKRWAAVNRKVEFSEIAGKTWQDYVRENRLEIACGEAPYLVSRYDTTTGEIIPINRRIGLLDRKLRVVSENTTTVESWQSWAMEAFKSIYGFDYQGDNVLLARENLLYTYADYFIDKFGYDPEIEELISIAEIISWNIWQMDGISMTVPYSKAAKKYVQSDISAFLEDIELHLEEEPDEAISSTIMDWKNGIVVEFQSLMKG